ncbi:ECM29 family proteasome component [Aspergillus chevalieri]|uniref:Proteasome component M29 n=1 Tax=Aspergillus chevalieri TaxID=182096 RepID=A0A7R7ZKV8_ASPCH|nr:proteasome component M29 [Aspergillus chevalieri]BCR84994.1 proteasome component M29 [Aspergillus chevalieri]
MASDPASASFEARELSLISKVELRIALAETDTKLQSLLQTYLAPLLLKLGSESLAVRNKVITVCTHINTRVQTPSIQLPVTALLKQFKEQKSQLIRHFDLIFLQQGLDRLGADARIEILLPLLQGISEIGTSVNQGATVFNLVLRLLPLLKVPPKGSEEDVQLKNRLGLSDQDTKFLSFWLEKLLLLSPADENSTTCPGLSPKEYTFLNKDAPIKETWNPSASGGLNLTETKANALKFLASGAFTDSERFLPALVATADANSRLADLGEEILKRFIPSLEDPDVVQQLYNLYFGTEEADGTPSVRPSLQIKLLVYLGKSIKATKHTEKVIRLIEEGLLSDAARSSRGLQASKLRTQIFTFTTWVVRMGSPSKLKGMAPKVVQGLRDFIQSQGWPSPGASGQRLPATDISLRGLAYESIGIMVPKVDFQAQNDDEEFSGFGLIKWLFTSLSCDDSSPEIFVSIEQALGSILNSSLDSWDKKYQEQLRPFLVDQMRNEPGEDDLLTGFSIVRGPQYAAVRFANRFLPYHDVVARWIDIIAIARGSERRHEVVEEGKKGLHPYWYRLFNPGNKSKGPDGSSQEQSYGPWYDFPSFSSATRFLFRPLDHPGNTNIGTLPASDILPGGYRKAFAPTITFLRNILLWESFSKFGIVTDIEQDWDTKLDVLLTSDERAREALRQYIASSDKESVLLFLQNALNGLLNEDREGLGLCGEHFVEICSAASNDIVGAIVPRVLSLKAPIFSNDQDKQNTAARAIGILASHPAFTEDDLTGFVTELSSAFTTWKSAIGELVLVVRGSILALSYLLSRLAFRGKLDKIPQAQVKSFIQTIFEIIESANDTLLRRAAQIAIGQLSLSGILSPTLLSGDGWKKMKESLTRDAKAETEVPILAMGRLSLAFSNEYIVDPQFSWLLDALYGLHEIRSPEIHFSVGEALSDAAIGWKSKALIREFDVDEQYPQSLIPNTVLADMCDKIIADCGASKPALRKASAIWLLCLVKNCGHMQEMQDRLRECQASFSSLLGDRDEIVQESGAQGLGLVYEMGDQELKDDLVRDLVNSFTANNSNLKGGKVHENTQLFEPGALPTGQGQSVNTYKDIMNLASEAGDPTLVYRFMSLASNNAIWTNRAAFSKLGISNIFTDSSVNGYLAKNPKIYPKLFRYRFDPNPNVQRSMNTIWHTLVKEPSTVINTHFDGIMDDLLKSMMTGREWRVRQASCTAISDMIQGRQPEQYSKYMDDIFAKAFKLLDDIKESVRASALKLCQTITNAVIRTLETSDADTKRANAMLGKAIPFLLSDKGMESGVQEVQGFAIGSLIQIIKKSPAKSLRPFVPPILEQFLNSLSSLEPQAVNYVHLNADKYGLTSEEIDKMRLSSIRTSPMMEVIERYLIDTLDETSVKDFAAKLEGVLRAAVGLPTKVGCSRVLVLLSMKTILFRPYADRFIQLLSKYVVDRNDTVSASYCSSIGYLMRLASDDRVLKTIEYAKTLYLTAEDATQRVISGEILHSTSKLSNDRFMAFAASALPFVFVFKHDTDEHVREVFEKTWQDNVGGTRTVSLYVNEITTLVSDNLESPRWAIKHTAALGIASAITSLDPELDLVTSDRLWPVLEKALAGKTWEGKEAVLKAFVKFAGQAKKLWQEKKQFSDSMKAIAIREAKRNNAAYRPHGLSALGGVAQARSDLNLMPDALAIASKVLEDVLDDDEDRMDIDSGRGQKSSIENTLAACIKCVLRCVNSAAYASGAIQTYLTDLIPVVDKALRNGGRTVQVPLYEELSQLLTRLEEWTSPTDGRGVDVHSIQGPLSMLAGELLTREIDVSVETIRTERAQAAIAYIVLSQQRGFEINEALCQSIQSWRARERSGPVQQILDQALAKLIR